MLANEIKEDVKREIMEELQAFGLTLEDLTTAEGAENQKWLQNWMAGRRLNTFERSLQQQALEKMKKDKETEKERATSNDKDSTISNASLNTSNDDNKSGSSSENNSGSPTPTKDNGTSGSPSSSLEDSEGVDIDDDAEPELDPLDELFEENPRKDDTHVYKGFYLEKNIAKTIDKKAKKGGKGMKSKIVNEALKIVFKEKGWIN